MRAAEFLQAMAQMMSALETETPSAAPAPIVVNVNTTSAEPQHAEPQVQEPQSALQKLLPVNKEPVSATDGEVMASPLQQELEIMKKAAGIPSAFDSQRQ